VPKGKTQVYALHVIVAIAEALDIDARIPRLYIAHGFMPHNPTSSCFFRFRVHLIISLVAIASCVGARTGAVRVPSPLQEKAAGVRTGIDAYESVNPNPLAGKRIGLVTNQTGVDSQGIRTIDVYAKDKSVKLVAIFSPEHGIVGQFDANVESTTDAATGLPIYSLYGETRRPTDAMLVGIDALVFDIQDAGVRFYTYITTMAYSMEAASKHHISFWVLDRPNPLGGEVIEGPVLDSDKLSFVGYFPMPVRYAMTMGELAQMFNAENKIGADLHVLAMTNWRRSEIYDQTGMSWIPPSPNLRTLDAAFLYPGIELLQAAGVSVGRGTSAPFEIVGAPWIHAAVFAEELNRRSIQGVRFVPATFTPSSGIYTGQVCEGATIIITDRAAIRSMRMGLEIADALHRMYPEQFQIGKMIELLGSKRTLDSLVRGETPAEIVSGWSADLDKFRATREKYLLYH
jgi:uncharacterized protein YbbC (DUF1343 family)